MTRRKKPSAFDEIDGGAAFAIPLTLLRHPNFVRLSPYAVKLVMDLGRQFTGYNNGYLCASWALMKDVGWNAPNTLQKAMLELEHYRLIVRTQQGGLNKPNLHGITWRKIDEKPKQRIDMAPTIKPLDSWKHDGIPDFVMPERTARKKGRAPLKAVA